MSFQGIAPIAFESVSAVTATPSVDVGTKRTFNGKEYIYVYNNGTSQISPGYLAIVSAVSGYSVTVSSLTNIGTPIGVCVHATFTTGTYGWLCREGFVQAQFGANNSAAVGDECVVGPDGAFARKVSANTDILQGTPFGKVMSAIASGASGTVYVKI